MHKSRIYSSVFKSKGVELVLQKGEYLFNKGDKPQYVYYIRSGIIKLTGNSISNKSDIIIEDEQFIGIKEMFINKEYQLSALVIESTEVIAVSKEEFFDTINENPKLRLTLMQFLSCQFDKVNSPYE